ncbi:hypothetical protein EDC33_1740 [Salinicoccus roseus]|nr:hypothetical protein EDC33_1740 [Salinicoccus roseus]
MGRLLRRLIPLALPFIIRKFKNRKNKGGGKQ